MKLGHNDKAVQCLIEEYPYDRNFTTSASSESVSKINKDTFWEMAEKIEDMLEKSNKNRLLILLQIRIFNLTYPDDPIIGYSSYPKPILIFRKKE